MKKTLAITASILALSAFSAAAECVKVTVPNTDGTAYVYEPAGCHLATIGSQANLATDELSGEFHENAEPEPAETDDDKVKS